MKVRIKEKMRSIERLRDEGKNKKRRGVERLRDKGKKKERRV